MGPVGQVSFDDEAWQPSLAKCVNDQYSKSKGKERGELGKRMNWEGGGLTNKLVMDAPGSVGVKFPCPSHLPADFGKYGLQVV